jgi:hypothetical protein
MSKYLAAIRVNPSYAPAYYNIAVIYSELNRYEEVPPLPLMCLRLKNTHTTHTHTQTPLT